MAESNITQSPFIYAANNPVNLIDFLGLDDEDPDEEEDDKTDEQKLIEYYQNLGYDVSSMNDVKTVVNGVEGMSEDFMGYIGNMITEGGFESFQNLYDMMPEGLFFNMANTFEVNADGWLGEWIAEDGMVKDAFHISEWAHALIGDGTAEMNQLEHFIGSFLMTAKYGYQGAHMMTTANEIRGLFINDRQAHVMERALGGHGGTAFEWSDLRNNRKGRKLYRKYARMKNKQRPFKENLRDYISISSF